MRPVKSLLVMLSFIGLLGAPVAAQEWVAQQSVVQQPVVPVVGEAVTVGLEPKLGDAVLEGVDWVWREEVYLPDAGFLKPHFELFDLRPGDVLIMRSHTGRVIESLRGRGPKDAGSFWGLSAFGDRFSLELIMASPYDVAPFRIDKIIAGDPAMFEHGVDGSEAVCGTSDFEDVICYQGDAAKWATVRASVGLMVVGGQATTSLMCSGSNLVGNRILTNNHCVANQTQCDNAEFVFKYYRTGCNDGSDPTMDWESFRCDALLVTQPFTSCNVGATNQDFSLLSVIGNPGATYGALVPDPTALTDGEAIYIVQHADGRPHEVTHGSGANVDVDGFNLRYFDTLDTEPASSGSPIFRESDNKLVGLHHCGGCDTANGNRGMLMSEIYPFIAAFLPELPFSDGFETGDTGAWDVEVP